MNPLTFIPTLTPNLTSSNEIHRSQVRKALERIDRKTHNLRAHFLRSIAHDPAKRAAWDLLAGIAYGVAEEDREAEATRRAEATEHVKQGATPKP